MNGFHPGAQKKSDKKTINKKISQKHYLLQTRHYGIQSRPMTSAKSRLSTAVARRDAIPSLPFAKPIRFHKNTISLPRPIVDILNYNTEFWTEEGVGLAHRHYRQIRTLTCDIDISADNENMSVIRIQGLGSYVMTSPSARFTTFMPRGAFTWHNGLPSA